MTTKIPLKTTISTSDPRHVILDPKSPAGLQVESRALEPVYSTYMPELSQLADRIFRDRLTGLKAREAHTVSIWVPGYTADGKMTVPRDAVVSDSGTPVPMSDVRPKLVFPTRTPLVDPRLQEFKGNLDLVSTFIAFTLASHVHSELERLKSESRKDMQVWYGDVSIIGEIPASLSESQIDGRRLSASCPMLYGRVLVFIDRK